MATTQNLHSLSAHELAGRINMAREEGNMAEADRLVALFNERLMNKVAQKKAVSSQDAQQNIQQTIDKNPDLSPKTISTAAPPTTPASTPDQSDGSAPPNLPVVDGDTQQNINTSTKNSADNKNNSPTGPSAEPPATPQPDEDPLAGLRKGAKTIRDYGDKVQPHLESLLEEMSSKLAIPRPVLEPQLLKTFEQVWREHQGREPLLLKLPTEIQQRSVLLRNVDEIKERLK